MLRVYRLRCDKFSRKCLLMNRLNEWFLGREFDLPQFDSKPHLSRFGSQKCSYGRKNNQKSEFNFQKKDPFVSFHREPPKDQELVISAFMT